MHNLKRNQTSIYYALYGEGTGIDEWGNPISGYTEPKPLNIALSANQGEATARSFGNDISYDREMSTTDMNLGIDEQTHLWIGIDPTKEHNYVVTKVAPGLNSMKYAIKQVKVTK